MVLTLVNNPKNLTIYTKRLPKKIYIKLKILNICYDSDRNICACLYTGSYYQCYATLLQNVFNLDTYLYILSCIFIVSIKITNNTNAMPFPRVIPELRDIKMVDNFDFFFVKYFGFHVFFLLSRP